MRLPTDPPKRKEVLNPRVALESAAHGQSANPDRVSGNGRHHCGIFLVETGELKAAGRASVLMARV